MIKKLLLAAAVLIALPFGAVEAQQPGIVTTQPLGVSPTQNSSAAISVTNTFQTIWTQSTNSRGRLGCTIQNKSASNTMYVFFGAVASATTPTALNLAPGATIYCQNGGLVQQDTVSITGTAGDRFYAGQN